MSPIALAQQTSEPRLEVALGPTFSLPWATAGVNDYTGNLGGVFELAFSPWRAVPSVRLILGGEYSQLSHARFSNSRLELNPERPYGLGFVRVGARFSHALTDAGLGGSQLYGTLFVRRLVYDKPGKIAERTGQRVVIREATFPHADGRFIPGLAFGAAFDLSRISLNGFLWSLSYSHDLRSPSDDPWFDDLRLGRVNLHLVRIW
ncbi:MAG: hypothetical protein AAGI08_02585 [Bacteroidota bacterium]